MHLVDLVSGHICGCGRKFKPARSGLGFIVSSDRSAQKSEHSKRLKQAHKDLKEALLEVSEITGLPVSNSDEAARVISESFERTDMDFDKELALAKASTEHIRKECEAFTANTVPLPTELASLLFAMFQPDNELPLFTKNKVKEDFCAWFDSL